jgi:23S rRNA (cytidine1920-2'-O)/16S rRNA (cytidine1409-2'-O)-methyltransferase
MLAVRGSSPASALLAADACVRKEITSNNGRCVCVRAHWRGASAISANKLRAMTKSRLDLLLAERGLFETRSRAAAAIMAGQVRLGGGGTRADKPGQMVAGDVEVSVDRGQEYVSRGGVKLANALDLLGIDVAGRRALDVGASTGGFTDVLLQRGAEHVAAVDVGYGELHWRLRQDPRVTVMERVNARALECDTLPYRPDLVVADVSFISLRKVLPSVLACAAEDFDCLAMVKPQFELDRGRVGKGGVVREAADRHSALVAVATSARELGHAVHGFAASGLPGPAGNRETFVWIAPRGRPGAVQDLEAAAAEADPA